LKVLLLTRYGRLGSSSRLRFCQYLPFLESQGFQVTVSPFFQDDYVERLYAGRPKSMLRILSAYLRRAAVLGRAKTYDLVWLEKEFFPWLPARSLEGVPYVVDYDDATFHRYDRHPSALVRRSLGGKIDSVMRGAALVVAGNEYLAARAKSAGAPRVEILPTVVDAGRYPLRRHIGKTGYTIGWIGAPVTAGYLERVRPALELCFAAHAETRLRLVGAADPLGMPDRIESRPWQEDTEAQELLHFDAGIMPLPDEPFERGKCGYKLIQYMAAGLPVVASPVGANTQIVEHGVNGFLAETTGDWFEWLDTLRRDPALRGRMGAAGRRKVEAAYSLSVTAPDLAEMLRSVL